MPEDSDQETRGIARTFRRKLEDLERATDYEAMLTVANKIKPAQAVKFNFSTRKGEEHMYSMFCKSTHLVLIVSNNIFISVILF